MKKGLSLIIILFSHISFAETQIAFVEMRDSQGNIHQLEPGGRFSHIAISYQGRWLHAHPYRGVELVDSADLEKIGSLTLVSVPNYKELTSKNILQYLGKPYDSSFSWDADGFYCSELVGKILGMAPEPMNFQAIIWKDTKPNRSVGLSPDDIFRKITGNLYRGRILLPRCDGIFH